MALQPRAGGFTQAYLVLHAGAFLHGVALAVGEELVNDVLQLAQDSLVGIGPEILAFVLTVAGEEQAGILLVGDAEVGVGLVVLQHAVVSGLVAFDEVVFQQQGVDLGSHHSDADVVDVPHQHLDFGALVLIVREVGADAPLQVPRLAHIDDCPRLVKVLIHSWRLGDGLQPHGYAVYVFVDAGVYHSGYSNFAFWMVKWRAFMPRISYLLVRCPMVILCWPVVLKK